MTATAIAHISAQRLPFAERQEIAGKLLVVPRRVPACVMWLGLEANQERRAAASQKTGSCDIAAGHHLLPCLACIRTSMAACRLIASPARYPGDHCTPVVGLFLTGKSQSRIPAVDIRGAEEIVKPALALLARSILDSGATATDAAPRNQCRLNLQERRTVG